MSAEPDGLDPREVKVLADILALVLQDEPAPSAVALETLRRRAQQNRVTGGALKNLFQSIAAQAVMPGFRNGAETLPDSPEAMRDRLERLHAANRALEDALAATNTEAARLQAALEDVQSRLAEAHRHNRGLAERWRRGRRQAALMAAAIGVCSVVIFGLTLDRLIRPAGVASITPTRSRIVSRAQPPARPPPQRLVAVPPPVLAAQPAEPPTASAAPERDPELEQALLRLSHSAAVETPADPAPAEPSAPARLPQPPPLAAAPSADGVGHLSPEAYSAIVAHVRTCWRGYARQLADPRFKARLQVVADERGVVRQAQLARDERPKLSDPSFRSFVSAAMRSVLDPECARLPIPPAGLGHRIAFDFLFVP